MKKTNLIVGCGLSGATIARKIAEELEDEYLGFKKIMDACTGNLFAVSCIFCIVMVCNGAKCSKSGV